MLYKSRMPLVRYLINSTVISLGAAITATTIALSYKFLDPLGLKSFAFMILVIPGAFIMLQLVVYWGDDHDLRITTPGAEGIQKESIFVSLHRAVRTRSATDPKDKAYAMYGILKGLGSSLSNPDYSKSVLQIYLGFFLDLLNWGQSLNLILDSGLPGLQNAPYWLPDWSAIAEEDWLDPRYVYKQTNTTATLASISFWSLSGETVLNVSSFLQDKIIFCSAELDQHDNTSRQSQLRNFSIFLRIFDAIRLHARLLGINDTISNAVYEVLHARASSHIEPDLRQDFNEWFQIMMMSISSGNKSIDEQASICLDEMTKNIRPMSYHISRCTALAKRRILFITSNGYIGTGSHNLALGDQVALISGIAMPVIFGGDQNGKYQLVGPSFVYGLMKGENWRGDASQDIALNLSRESPVLMSLVHNYLVQGCYLSHCRFRGSFCGCTHSLFRRVARRNWET
jgi:hypothetical protein